MKTNLRSKNRAFFAKIFPGKLILAAFAILLFCGSNLRAGAKAKLAFPPIYAADINGFPMTPQFDVNINNYTATVPDSVSSVTLFVGIINYDPSGNNGSPINPGLAINGQPVVTNNQPGGGGTFVIPLAVGITVVQFGLDSANASRSFSQNYPYTLTIVRAAGPPNALSSDATLSSMSTLYQSNISLVPFTISPAFNSNVTSYTASVPGSSDALYVVGHPNGPASVTYSPAATIYTPFTESYSLIPISPGINTVNVIVTAEDGFTTKTYTLTVTRSGPSDASLYDLSVYNGTLSPSFASTTKNYTDTVANSVTYTIITASAYDGSGTLTVNGVSVPNGSRSYDIPLSVGSNTITVVNTSHDGTATSTYTITVIRAPLSNANLANLAISNGLLSPAFAAGNMSYRTSVFNNITSITVTPTTGNPTMTVTVNGIATPSGSPSAAIPLTVGTNTITAVVTAQDGTINTYTIAVYRQPPSSNADLAGIALSSAATFSPSFSSHTLNYNVTEANNVTLITVTPTASDAAATVTVNGIALTTRFPSARIPLTVGANTITILVTAQDGTNQTYTITVDRAPSSSNAALANLALSNGTLSPLFDGAITSYGASVASNIKSITVTPTTSDPTATVTVNGTVTPSGSASAAVPIRVGANSVTTVVTAQDGTSTTYTIIIYQSPSHNELLSNLVLSNVALSPPFASGSGRFDVSVANNISSVAVTPTAADATATLRVNGVVTISGSASAAINLSVGVNVIAIKVTAQDSITTNTYVIYVTRASPNNADLAGLALNNGALSPTFASGTTSYSASVANNIPSITVTPTTSDATATVTVNGVATPSGSASAAIPLTVGANTITTVVTAQDGTTIKTYTVTVTRAPLNNANLVSLALSNGTLSPAFAVGNMGYNASVANSVTSIMVTPTTSDPTATVTVNGTAVSSGTQSAAIPLSVGANAITTLVTAQDGTTVKTYTVTVTRAPSNNALLAGLTLSSGTLSPSFASGTMSYSASVGNNISSLTVTPTPADATATVTVNGTVVISPYGSALIPLSVGANTFRLVVTAQDGTTINAYTVTVDRAQSSNALLSNLMLNIGTLSPSFASGIMNYNVSVANNIPSVLVIPTTSDSTAKAVVFGTVIPPGNGPPVVPLSIGANTITTVVIAQDGTINTYKIIVTRGGTESGNATLSALKLSAGIINPSFVSTTSNYNVSVSNSTTTFAVTPTASKPASSITVNGINVVSGSQSPAIPISIGANNITIVVTNSSASKTYTVTVTRVLSDYAYLANLQPGSGSLSPAFAYATLNYNVRVGRTIYSFTVTPTTLYPFETVKVNGLPVASGTASQAIPLADGLNNISIVVTAQNGTNIRTYTLLVNKESGSTYNVYQANSVNSEALNNQLTVNDIIVHQALSPNGDGINDVLLIDGISLYPQNKLSIMDLNGKLVYEAEGYDNSSRVFDGHSNKTGTMQEPGTYYYLLEYTAGNEKKRSTGFFILKY